MKQLSYQELAEKLWSRKDLTNWGFDFCGNYNQETDEKEWWYRAGVIRFADSQIVLINYLGGGAGFIYDIDEDGDASGLACCLRSYFSDQGLEESVWVEDPNEIRLPAELEYGAVVGHEFDSAGEEKSWWVRMAQSDVPGSTMDPYHECQLDWMIEHGHSLQELIQELTEYQFDDPEDSDRISSPISEIFTNWEQDVGFGSEIWACRAEWEDADSQEDTE